MAQGAERGLVWIMRWGGAGWLDAGADWVVDPVPAQVERDLRKYRECGILAHGFARAKFYSWRFGRHGKKAGVRAIYSRYSGRCPRDLSSSVTPDTRINSTIISSGLPIAQMPAGLAAASRYRPHHTRRRFYSTFTRTGRMKWSTALPLPIFPVNRVPDSRSYMPTSNR